MSEEKLKHGKGSFSGNPYTLLPWQRKIIEQLFGVVDADGNLIHREVYIVVECAEPSAKAKRGKA